MTIDKLELMERLRAAGVWDQAEAYREVFRELGFEMGLKVEDWQ